MTAIPNSGSLAACVSAINYLMFTFLRNAVWRPNWVTTHASFRKHETAELRTILNLDDRQKVLLRWEMGGTYSAHWQIINVSVLWDLTFSRWEQLFLSSDVTFQNVILLFQHIVAYRSVARQLPWLKQWFRKPACFHGDNCTAVEERFSTRSVQCHLTMICFSKPWMTEELCVVHKKELGITLCVG